MYMKIHRTGESEVVAVCDEELVGKCFEEDGVCLDVSESFYKGDKVDGSRVLKVCKDARAMNVVGKKSVKLFLDAGMIVMENVREVKGVPFVIIG